MHDWSADATPQPVSGLTPDTQSVDDVEPVVEVVWFKSGHSVQGGPPLESPYDPFGHSVSSGQAAGSIQSHAADPTLETDPCGHA